MIITKKFVVSVSIKTLMNTILHVKSALMHFFDEWKNPKRKFGKHFVKGE